MSTTPDSLLCGGLKQPEQAKCVGLTVISVVFMLACPRAALPAHAGIVCCTSPSFQGRLPVCPGERGVEYNVSVLRICAKRSQLMFPVPLIAKALANTKEHLTPQAAAG